MSETDAEVNHDTTSAAPSTLSLVSRAAQDGAADAREAAARTWDSTSLFLKRFIYTSCYTISYGVVFPSALLARSIPKDNAIVRGLIDGAEAAKLKVDELRSPALDSAGSEPSLSLA